ncbi:MAG: hypothetical protein ACOYVK_08140 [Bacillota bacterium]
MKQIKTQNGQKMGQVTSREIQEIIEGNGFFEDVRDISDTVHEDDVLAYNIKLDQSILEREIERDLEEEGYMMDDEEEFSSLLLEQAGYFIDAAVDEMKDHIEKRYHVDNIDTVYDVYQGQGGMEDIRFVLTLSFGAAKHSQLYQLTSGIIDKNYTQFH